VTREQAQLVRLLLMCVAWSVGQLLTVGIPVQLADIVVPAALAIGVYVVTEDLGRPRVSRGDVKYWRGRQIDGDDEQRRGGRLN
jgi:hypothetical protein